ncbi:MAG TPA: hypothetical protein VMB83_03355 [Roseiarcus sp.]|nr:hypothetical protein [Roseiarcus sp.]
MAASYSKPAGTGACERRSVHRMGDIGWETDTDAAFDPVTGVAYGAENVFAV